jgi:hypothetical protein
MQCPNSYTHSAVSLKTSEYDRKPQGLRAARQDSAEIVFEFAASCLNSRILEPRVLLGGTELVRGSRPAPRLCAASNGAPRNDEVTSW